MLTLNPYLVALERFAAAPDDPAARQSLILARLRLMDEARVIDGAPWPEMARVAVAIGAAVQTTPHNSTRLLALGRMAGEAAAGLRVASDMRIPTKPPSPARQYADN